MLAVGMASEHSCLVEGFDLTDGPQIHSWLVMNPDAYTHPEVKAFAKFFATKYRETFA
ncbi:MAG TPA: hypothetical protein VLA51_05525 [Paracoccaceae bacterium]|nr:hypothetical protein [Paracoccaceae bacterium]